jgi:hypothetical protein
MAIRLERSGGLIFIHGAPEDPKAAKSGTRNRRRLGLLLVLIALVIGLLLAGPHALGWPGVSHAFKTFLAAVR